MRKVIGLTSASLVGLVMLAGQAFAWSEKNCQNLCRTSMPGQQADCERQFNCPQYRGKKHVGAGKEQSQGQAWKVKHGYSKK